MTQDQNLSDDKYKPNSEDIKRLAEQKKFKLEKEAEEKLKMGSWDGNTSVQMTYGFNDFFKFAFPFLWKGSCWIKFTTVFTFFLLFASRMANIAHPLILRVIINNISCDPEDTDLEDGCPGIQSTYMLIIAYAATKFGADFLNYIREVPFSVISANAEKYIASMVYSHVQRQSLAFHLSRETGKIIRIVSKGSSSFAQVFRYMLFNIAPMIVEIILIMVTIALLFPMKYFFLNFGCIALYLLSTVLVTEWRAKYFKIQSKKDAEYVQRATDSLLNFETVKYFNAENHEESRFLVSLKAYKVASVVVAKSLVTLNMSQSLVILFGLCGTLVLSYQDILDGNMKVGDFIVFNTYILQIYVPLGFLGTFWRFIRQAWTDIELVLDILEQDQAIKEESDPIKANIHSGEIEFKNVSFTYDQAAEKKDQRQILYNLSFKVPAGKSVALVGATGSGKSTIMRLLYRFYDITEGQILIDGQDISKMKIDDLRSNIAIVPQDCVLFNDTVMYNIAYGGIKDEEFKSLVDDQPAKEKELQDKILPAAKRAQIHEYIQKKAKGYMEIVGERGLKLSGGEKQRVAISRALLKKTQIMCFDEATSALDTETEKLVQEAIDDISKDSTSIMIAHRLSTIRNCDIIIALKHGVIMEQGSHDELLKIEDGYYKQLWNKQAESKEIELQQKQELANLLEERRRIEEERKKNL